MICPNIANKQVVQEFNEIVEALGGTALTMDEFKSAELRSLRKGILYSAMEAAYKIWHLNNGNSIDCAPNGAQSILFQTLLGLKNGDRKAAIVEKSKVYSLNFRDWFGDWTSEDNSSVSKVVDENGEPKIVYHHTDDNKLNEFRTDFDNYFSKIKNGTKSAIFFTENAEKILNRKYTIPVFLNLKSPFEYNGTKESMHKTGTSYTLLVNDAEQQQGAIFTGLDDNKLENQTVLVAYNSNNIKSAIDNNGDYSKKNNNIYALKISTPIEFEECDIESLFGEEINSQLQEQGFVESKNLVVKLLGDKLFKKSETLLAKLLSTFNVPVFVDNTNDPTSIAETIVDEKGRSIIVLNKNLISKVSKGYASTAILHELMHAVTVEAFNNPKSKEDRLLVKETRKIFNTYNKLIPNYPILAETESGLYAFLNQKEFVSVFMTDHNVRKLLFLISKQEDNEKSLSNMFKSFINSIARFFTQKDIFKSNEERAKKYYDNVINYITNKSNNYKYNKGDIVKLYKQAKLINGTLDFNESVIDFFKRVNIFLRNIDINALKLPFNIRFENNRLKFGDEQLDTQASSTQHYNNIVLMLNTRLKALRSSGKNVKDKERLIIETTDQIESFTNDYISKFNAITSLTSLTAALLYQDLQELKNRYNNDDEISGDEYMYHAHANFGMYRKLTETLCVLLQDDDNISLIINQYNKDKKDEDKLSFDNIEELKQQIKSVNALCLDAVSILNNVREKITLKKLSEVRNEVGAIDLDPIIKKLNQGDPILDEDISVFESWLGAADASSSPVIRSLVYIVGKAKDKAEKESMDAMDELLDASNGMDVTKVYERHERRLTGYFLRRLNYGRFYQDYDKAMIEINRKVAKKYNIVLSDNNRVAPHLQEARVMWHSLRNKWLNDHAERRYTKEYYEAWSKVPEIARLAMQSYNNEINMILKDPKYQVKYTEDGVKKTRVAYEKISDEDWEKLQHLWILKKNLRSDIDIFGNRKEGEMAEISKALQQLDIDLGYDSKSKKGVSKNVEGWKKARNEEIEACGGKEAYDKWLNGEENHGFNNERFEKWDRRNTIRVLKRDEDGEIAVFKKIRKIMHGIKINWGTEYEALSDEASKLLKDYRDQQGDVIADELPLSVKNRLIEIYERQSDIRKEAKAREGKDGLLTKLSNEYKELFDIYLKHVDTEYYEAIKKRVYESADDEDYDPEFVMEDYYAMLTEYGTPIYDDFDLVGVRPYSWLQRLESTKPEYMETLPGNAWIEREDNDQYLNKEFERLSQMEGNENVSMIPKESIYLNKDYDRLMSDDKFKRLYKATIALNRKANAKQTNRQYTDDYLAPLITGTLSDRIMNAPGILHKIGTIFNWIKEKVGISKNSDDSAILGDASIDYSQNEMDQIFVKHKNSLRGKYPDGRNFNIIPQFYTRRLEDPSIISTDLLDVMHQYYLMSASYELKSKIKGDCEVILDQISDKSYTSSSNDTIIGGLATSESHTYLAARKFLEMNLYNIKRTTSYIPFTGKKYEVTKSFELWKEYATARNLGANPKVALVGFLTSSYVHLINMITGSVKGVAGKYNFKIGCKAFTEVLFKLLKTPSYLSNARSNDKMMLIMEFADLSNQMQRKYKYSNRNRLTGTISKNYVYGFLTMSDFVIKSQIALSEVMAYRYVDGEFLTMADIMYNRKTYGEEVYRDKMDKYKKAKQSLYSILKSENGKLTVDDKYKEAWNKIQDVLRNRILKTAENADGMATSLQRNALSQNIVGALILMHRQYLPLMLQEAWGKQVYDYDAQRYKNGQFRSITSLIKELMMSNALAGAVSGGIFGYALGGAFGSIIAQFFNIAYRRYGIRQERLGIKEKKNYKLIFKEHFSDFSTIESTHKSYANREQLAKTVIEILLFNILTNPIINAICKAYKDDDRLLIQFLLYILRAFQWESYTKYRTSELFNNIKTATAASSVTDGINEFMDRTNSTITNTIFPRGSAFDPLLDIAAMNPMDTQIQSGTYKGYSPITKVIIQGLPWHNALEQATNPKAKRLYHETQIQKIPKEDR